MPYRFAVDTVAVKHTVKCTLRGLVYCVNIPFGNSQKKCLIGTTTRFFWKFYEVELDFVLREDYMKRGQGLPSQLATTTGNVSTSESPVAAARSCGECQADIYIHRLLCRRRHGPLLTPQRTRSSVKNKFIL